MSECTILLFIIDYGLMYTCGGLQGIYSIVYVVLGCSWIVHI